MPYSEWVHPDYEVKIEHVSELQQMVGPQGYVRRAFGISSGIVELLSHISRDTLIQDLEECTIFAETTALEALDVFISDEAYEEHANYDMEAYYPSCVLEVEFDDGVEHEIHVCVNQREQSAGYHKRFICVLSPDEIETYRLERANQGKPK